MKESMITKKKKKKLSNNPYRWINKTSKRYFFWIVPLSNLQISRVEWKNEGERSFSIFLPLPLPLHYLIAAEFPRKMSEGTRYSFESSAKKFLSPGGLTGPASDAGASVATGMSRNARRTVTPTSIARCCTAWHGARDNHRPGREGKKRQRKI